MCKRLCTRVMPHVPAPTSLGPACTHNPGLTAASLAATLPPARTPAYSRLRSLTLRGGKFSPSDVALLLRGLAVACPALEELRVLPEALCGLGDDEMPLVAALAGLKVGPGAEAGVWSR